MISATHFVRRAAGVGLLAALVLLPAAGAGAGAGEKQTSAKQTASSTGGIVAIASLGYGLGSQRPSNLPRGWSVLFSAPAGAVTGTGPLDPTDPADLRKTWVAVDEDGPSGDMCAAFANPANLKVSYDGAWAFHAVFDVTCPKDGMGYSFYRIYLDGDPRDSAHYVWQNSFDAHAGNGGDGTLGSSRMLDVSGTYSRVGLGSVRVCGYRSSGFTCYSSSGHAADIDYTDGFTSVERPY